MISINIWKICGESILKAFKLIFKSCIESGKFPVRWKKGKCCPSSVKYDNQLKENCRPILFLPISGKILERLIYNKMF